LEEEVKAYHIVYSAKGKPPNGGISWIQNIFTICNNNKSQASKIN